MLDLVIIVRSLGCLALAALAGALLLELLGQSPVLGSRRGKICLATTSAALIALQLAAAAFEAAPDDGLFALQPLLLLVSETWSGGILAARIALSLVLAVWFGLVGRWRIVPWALALLGLALIPLSGHSSTAEPASISMIFHGMHVAAALLWFGALVNIALLAAAGPGKGQLRESLAAFSPYALALILIAILAGIAAGVFQIGRPAALIGTAYGQALLVKAAILLPVALASAAWLRTAYLRRSSAQSPHRALAIETLAGVGMLILACMMSQTAPSRHDDIVWPLSSGSIGTLPGRRTASAHRSPPALSRAELPRLSRQPLLTSGRSLPRSSVVASPSMLGQSDWPTSRRMPIPPPLQSRRAPFPPSDS